MIRIFDRNTMELLFVYPYNTFRGRDLRGLPLKGANLSDQDLEGAILEGMDLEDTEFSNSNIKKGNFRKTILVETIFNQAQAQGADFSDAKCASSTWAGAIISGADYTGSDLEHANFKDVIARRTKFIRIKSMKGVILWNADCSEADFSGTNLNEVNDIDKAGLILDRATGVNNVRFNDQKIKPR